MGKMGGAGSTGASSWFFRQSEIDLLLGAIDSADLNR
jgi:hypothetical protein